jgi:hypothetical protein
MMRGRTSNVDLRDFKFEALGFKFAFDRLRGLDSITSLDPLAPAGPQILENRFEMEQLKLEFGVNVEMDDSVEEMTLSYTVRDIQAQVDLLVAMDLNRLGEIKLGSFFDMGHILYSAVSGLQDFKFSKLMLSVGRLEDPVIQGYFSGENRDKIQWIFENMFDKYRDELMNALPLLLDSTFREIANGLLPSLLDSVSSQCSAPQVYPADATIDFLRM